MTKRRLHWVGLAGALLMLPLGCVNGGKGLSSEDREKLKPFILETAPEIPHKLDINFENRVHLIGYKFDPELAKPGQEVKITFYWRCDDKLDEGWLLFTHLHDPVSDHADNLDWKGPLRENKADKQLFGPERWERGKIYVDEQTYTMQDWLKGPELAVYTGLWRKDARLRIVAGPNDGDNRALVGKIKTGLVPPPPAPKHSDVPKLTVMKLAAGEKIVIDGKGDDKAWGAAASTGPFVDVGTGKANPAVPVQGSAKLTWDDQNLYVLFEVSSPDVVGYFTSPEKQPNDWTVNKQPKLWGKDTVELMVDPDGDGDKVDYYELQVNPQNKLFRTQYDGYNVPKTEPNGPFGHEDWDPKLKSAVVVRGTVDKPDDKDEGYTVEAAIPWAAFAKAKKSPPEHGNTWRMNFYAMKNNGGTSWSPILGEGNFHFGPRFGRVVFAVPGQPLLEGQRELRELPPNRPHLTLPRLPPPNLGK